MGSLVGGELRVPPDGGDFFEALDLFLKTHQAIALLALSRGDGAARPTPFAGLPSGSTSGTAAKGYVRTQARLKEVFDHFDRDGNGHLDATEMKALLRMLLPECTGEDVVFFITMLDVRRPRSRPVPPAARLPRSPARRRLRRRRPQVDGDGSITYAELLEGVRDCLAAGRSAASTDIEGVLARLKEYMQARRPPLRRAALWRGPGRSC